MTVSLQERHEPFLLARRGVYVGITAWTEPSLVASQEFYPPEVTTAEQRLRYYATRFPIAEVDSTFYWPASESTAQLWVQRTPTDFVFNVKAFRLLTHHPTPPSSLWRDVRDALPEPLRKKDNVYAKHLPFEVLGEALARTVSALTPLDEAGKLGALLFQFPRYVYPSRRAYRYLEWLAANLGPLRGAIEFRQQRWMDDEHRADTLQLLRSLRLSYVSVDEPQGFDSSVPPFAEATTDLAIVRFHGRNAAYWQRPAVIPSLRFGYDYSADELAEWVPKIERLHERARAVHVLFNNCHEGYAVRSAIRMAHELSDSVMTVG